MQLVRGSDRIFAVPGCDPVRGEICWDPAKSIWIGSMTISALVLAPMYFTWSAFFLFLFTSAITLCAGHSVGMHRRLIHGSFECPMWLEYLCVYLGVLVGMAGPIGMMKLHDMRDWAQRQPDCHPYFAHRAGFWHDAWHQLHCRIKLDHPPVFVAERRVKESHIYRFLEHSWMAQQIPWTILFFALGGLSWLVWGICVRVSVCVIGHWLVGYFAHREGQQSWIVEGASVQGHNVRIAGLISMGESWHNNHHAFPGSAKLGLERGQVDLGWVLLLGFRHLGLAWNIVTPDSLPHRPALRRILEHKAHDVSLPDRL